MQEVNNKLYIEYHISLDHWLLSCITEQITGIINIGNKMFLTVYNDECRKNKTGINISWYIYSGI